MDKTCIIAVVVVVGILEYDPGQLCARQAPYLMIDTILLSS